MSSRTLLFRFALLATLLIVSIPLASGWAIQNWSATPAGSELPPGTPVTAGYSIHFESWTTGSTFNKDNTLTMYTDLVNPQWVVTKIQPMDDQPSIIEEIPVRQAAQVRLDGWSLSYVRKRFDLSVQLTGKTPALNQSGTISIVKLQELSPGAKAVTGSLIKKETRVVVPTPEPTVAQLPVTVNMTPAEIIEVTPEQKGPDVTITPTKKVTYSPGPGPVVVAGLLAGLVLVARYARRNE
jgi:hypothetical protein